MTQATLAAGNAVLVRATADCRRAVERLQQAAYARNRELLDLEPLPLLADYDAIFRQHEVWVKNGDRQGIIDAALILETDRPADKGMTDVLVWSIAIDPALQKSGLGRALLDGAETRARQLGRSVIRLYTGQPLTHLIDWYARNGYEVERVEPLPDRTVVHMLKTLA